MRVGEGEFPIEKVDSKHHTTRFDYCLNSHHQACSESKSTRIIKRKLEFERKFEKNRNDHIIVGKDRM